MKQHCLRLYGDHHPLPQEVIHALESPVALARPVQCVKNLRIQHDKPNLQNGERQNGELQYMRLATNQKTEHGASCDPVIGLPSRHLFHDRVTQAVRVAQRSQTIFGIACLGLAHFEEVSDVYGPTVGDVLQQQVVERIRQRLRPLDTATRLDGDTFVLLLHGWLVNGMSARLTAILQDVSLPFSIQDKKVLFSGSAGLAVFPTHGTEYGALLKHAEIAMHKATVGRPNNLPRLGWPKA